VGLDLPSPDPQGADEGRRNDTDLVSRLLREFRHSPALRTRLHGDPARGESGEKLPDLGRPHLLFLHDGSGIAHATHRASTRAQIDAKMFHGRSPFSFLRPRPRVDWGATSDPVVKETGHFARCPAQDRSDLTVRAEKLGAWRGVCSRDSRGSRDSKRRDRLRAPRASHPSPHANMLARSSASASRSPLHPFSYARVTNQSLEIETWIFVSC